MLLKGAPTSKYTCVSAFRCHENAVAAVGIEPATSHCVAKRYSDSATLANPRRRMDPQSAGTVLVFCSVELAKTGNVGSTKRQCHLRWQLLPVMLSGSNFHARVIELAHECRFVSKNFMSLQGGQGN